MERKKDVKVQKGLTFPFRLFGTFKFHEAANALLLKYQAPSFGLSVSASLSFSEAYVEARVPVFAPEA